MLNNLDVVPTLSNFQQEILECLKTLVDINSNSANPEGLSETAQAIEDTGARHGISFERISVKGKETGPFHLLHDGFVRIGEDFYGIIGHFDTVHQPNSGFSKYRKEGERIYGPGVLDMKGGIVAALYSVIIARKLLVQPLPVKILFNCDEEIGSPDSRMRIERIFQNARGVFVFESARGWERGVVVARKGILMGEMKITGIPAHAGENPEAGADAILEAARKIDALHGLNDPDTGTVVTVGKIAGGSAANQISDHCRGDLDVRVVSSREEENVRQKIEKIMQTITVEGTHTEYSLVSARPPFVSDDISQELLREYTKAAAAFGLQTENFTSGGGSDANFTAAMGIPTLDGLGPSGEGPHTDNEYILERSLWDSISVFTLFLGNLINHKEGEVT